jgi:ABC-type protease/lipase transport system fused ATPase/permease subunit
MSAFDPKRTSAYLFCRDAVHGCRMVMAKGRQQQFGPKEQILARFTAQTNRQSRRRPIRPRGL